MLAFLKGSSAFYISMQFADSVEIINIYPVRRRGKKDEANIRGVRPVPYTKFKLSAGPLPANLGRRLEQTCPNITPVLVFWIEHRDFANTNINVLPSLFQLRVS
jgi:hypothetical protein